MADPKPFAGYEKPLLDAVSLFDQLDIAYALVGGLAAMVYGRARFTDDLDFVAVTGHREQLEASGKAMRRHHFDPACTWKLYHDSGVEIDIWKDEHADGIVQRATEATLAGRTMRVAEPHDLVAMKLRADRPQDDYDISEITRQTPIDRQRLAELVAAEQLSRFDAIVRRTR